MATQAALAGLFRGRRFEVEDLGYIAAAVNVLTARAMAAFAGHAILAVLEGNLCVWIAGEVLHHVFMASRAGLRTHKIRLGLGLRGFGLTSCRLCLRCCAPRNAHSKDQRQHADPDHAQPATRTNG